mgnify:CR=1 FL=1
MTTMSSPATPDPTPVDYGETGPAEPPDTERLAKLAGENARLRSEIRQTLTRAQRAEADATRVRSSTKFQVGDLLVKAARHPKRLLLLPRDLIRLYRLRGHRRTQPEAATGETGLGRARRSDYTDEIAARLLLPRIAEQPSRPLAVAGALDPLTATQWGDVVAITHVLPHDAGALIRDVDPDVVVIDTAAAGPFGTWSHLGDPAATDRALAARELITSAKGLGRPIMLLRSRHDGAGFDAIAASCDLVVDLPGSRPTKAWQPGLALGSIMRVEPSLVRTLTPGESDTSHDTGVLIADVRDPLLPIADDTESGSDDTSPARGWTHRLAEDGIPLRRIDMTAPPITAIEAAVRSSTVVALAADQSHDIVGGPLLALLALASGRRLVGPEDRDLRSILGLSAQADTRQVGWFPYLAGDTSSALHALDEALQAPRIDLHARWSVWRAIFERASACVAWDDAVTRLGLGAQPLSHRHVAIIMSAQPADHRTIEVIAELATSDRSPIREIVCERSQVDLFRTVLAGRGSTSIPVFGISTDIDSITLRARAAQACSSHLLLEIIGDIDAAVDVGVSGTTISLQDLTDAVIAYEIADSPGQVEIKRAIQQGTIDSGAAWALRITDRQRALSGEASPTIIVDHPGART